MTVEIVAVALAVALAPPAAPKGPDACALLPRADAEAAVGAVVDEPHREGGTMSGVALSVCQYTARGKNGVVRLSVERYESPEFLALVTEDLGKRAGDEPVAGLGQRAFWRGGARTLKVVADHDLLSLDLVAATDVKTLKDQTVALMRKIFARR